MSNKIIKEKISGWGNYPAFSARVVKPKSIDELVLHVKNGDCTSLARGGKTSYGDASLNGNGLNIDMKHFNEILSFSSKTGVLNCQSMVRLSDIIKKFHNEGWFLNVTPGTQRASVGGCIACDSHGKNWEAGSFCNYVVGFNIMVNNGSVIWCDEDNNSDLYFATCGGLGMTGVIIDVKMILKRIPSSYVNVETIQFKNLEELFELQQETMDTHEYLFSWLDSQKSGYYMGRGVMQRANHCKDESLNYKKKKEIQVPFNLPNFAINKLSVKSFNTVYYLLRKQKNNYKEYFLDFFYPLDGFTHWNRVYGRKGFVEYQIVIPHKNSFKTISKLLTMITKSGLGSTVAAIKPLKKSKGLLSFPIDGITLAVDFAYNSKLWPLLDQLDEIVIENKGRVYLAKDCRLNSTNFRKMYSDALPEWESVRERYNFNNKFNSTMFDRIYKS